MSETNFFWLFILCVILCQEIGGIFSADLSELNSLVRRKRVINLDPGRDIPLQKTEAPFVVNIRHSPYNISIGVGAILSGHTVITAAALVNLLDVTSIKILSASANLNRGVHHDVIAKHVHLGNHPHSESDGIALLTVQQHFIFNKNTKPIALHTEPLLGGTPATIFGWGFNPSSPRGTNHPLQLRSITVRIMYHRECVNVYQNRHVISDKDICTYDPNKHCGHSDVGAPLVVNNHLAGLYLWTGKSTGHRDADVYLIVQHVEYLEWIRNNLVHNI